MYGSWQYCDYISHSAIIITADITFDLDDTDTLEDIDLISKWGECGVYTHNGDECPYGTKDASFQYVTAYRPKTNASYTLSNYSSTINEAATISSSHDNTNNYEMYELNVNYSKNYEFKIISIHTLDARLYDEHMQLISVNDVDPNNNTFHLIKQLINGKRYYLRIAYANEESTGTINTQIISRNTSYLTTGENDKKRQTLLEGTYYIGLFGIQVMYH